MSQRVVGAGEDMRVMRVIMHGKVEDCGGGGTRG